MGVFAWIVYGILVTRMNLNLALVITIGAGAAIYFTMIYFMKIKEADSIKSSLKAKLKAYS